MYSVHTVSASVLKHEMKKTVAYEEKKLIA